MLRSSFARTLCLAAALVLVPALAGATSTALVIAIDTSGSIDNTEFDLQRAAYVNFFADNAAAFAGADVDVTVMYWAGDGIQQQVVGWTNLNSASDATNFASAINGTSRPAISSGPTAQTAVSQAINFATGLFSQQSFGSADLVLDISGDGTENFDTALAWDLPTISFQGGTANFTASTVWGSVLDAGSGARANALAAGILINALPIIPIPAVQSAEIFDSQPASALFPASPPMGFPASQQEWDAAILAVVGNQTILEFFYSQVIGSPDSRIPLMIVANGFTAQELGDKISQKLSQELGVPEPGVTLLLGIALGAFALRSRQRA